MSDDLRALTARVTALEQRNVVQTHTHTGNVTLVRAKKEADTPVLDAILAIVGIAILLSFTVVIVSPNNKPVS